MLDRRHAFHRLGRQVDELTLTVTGETGIVLGQVADDDGNDLFAERFRQLELLLALYRVQSLRRREQHDRLARCVGLAQGFPPALSRTDAVQVDEHIVRGPAIGDEPALENERGHVVAT